VKGVVITERNVIAMLRALTAGRQSEPTDSNEIVDQLIEQLEATRVSLRQTREELVEARAEHARMMADLQAHFDEEVAEMRKMLTDARAELAKFQAFNSFERLERSGSDSLN
jgi:hypothetical protein